LLSSNPHEWTARVHARDAEPTLPHLGYGLLIGCLHSIDGDPVHQSSSFAMRASTSP